MEDVLVEYQGTLLQALSDTGVVCALLNFVLVL